MSDFDRFFTLDEINPKLKILQERFDEIHQELLENKDKLHFLNWGGEAGYYMREDIAYKGWKVAPLYGNFEDFSQINGGIKPYLPFIEVQGELVKYKQNTRIMPVLTEILIQCGIRKRVGISVVDPGKEIGWHIDPDPEKFRWAIVRGLFGLDVIEEEGKESFIYLKSNSGENQKRVFKNKEFVFLWGRTEHKVENHLSKPRYMICFDEEIERSYLSSL